MRRWHVATIVTGIATLLGAAAASSQAGQEWLTRLSGSTELHATPDGERLGMLLSGAQVRVLERQGDWMRVELSGWIPASSAPGGEPVAQVPVAQATIAEAPAAPPTEAKSTAASISGSIFVAGKRGRTLVGAGTTILLIQDPAGAAAARASLRADCDSRRQALLEEADRLEKEADRALKRIESTSKAFETSDGFKRQRAGKVAELNRLDDECAAKEAEALAPYTRSRALTSAEGRYRFDAVPPGRYTLSTFFEAEKSRHSWEVETTLEAGSALTLDLTEANRRSITPVVGYR